MSNENLLLIPEKRVEVAKESLRLAIRDFRQIKFVAGFGSFWTNKPNPGDIDILVGTNGRIDKSMFAESFLQYMLKNGIPLLGVDLAEIDMEVALRWETSDPGLLWSFIKEQKIWLDRVQNGLGN